MAERDAELPPAVESAGLRRIVDPALHDRVPHFNSISNYLEDPDLTPFLKSLVERSAMPLSAVEVAFAADSSGFTTSRFHRWFDHKYGKVHEKHDWVKCHIVCGLKTNVVTAVEIGNRDAHDAQFLPPMLTTTARSFNVFEFVADKAYASLKNVEAIEAVGAMPFIAPKSNATGERGGGWEKMINYFKFCRDEFLQHYHQLSNVEATFASSKVLEIAEADALHAERLFRFLEKQRSEQPRREQLRRETSGSISFQYDSPWLEWEFALPVSLSLPLREQAYSGAPRHRGLRQSAGGSEAVRRNTRLDPTRQPA